MQWTPEQIARDTPKLLSLKAITDVHFVGTTLYFRTADLLLKHSYSLLPMISIECMLAREYTGAVRMKYKDPYISFLHWHPTIDGNRRIGGHDYRAGCLGESNHDIAVASEQGPYAGTLEVLAMLQSIRRENSSDVLSDWLTNGAPVLFLLIVIGGLGILAWAIIVTK